MLRKKENTSGEFKPQTRRRHVSKPKKNTSQSNQV
jgi:hypothetical protein